MQDKQSGLQAHVDEWERGQNNAINIELAEEIVSVALW